MKLPLITRWLCTAALAALAGLALVPRAAQAGGGPENVFLVVNSASWASQTVANQFIALRKIPPANVFYINWLGGTDSIDGETFRTQILVPTLRTVEQRGMMSQIDYVIYSSDFPYGVDLGRDFSAARLVDQARPGCSINSATYFWHLVLSKNPLMMDFHANHYMRGAEGRAVDVPTREFRSWYGWGNAGELIEAGGQPYMLSTMLGMTSGRGNSVSEVISYLRRSAAADGTRPKGTIYFCLTEDDRVKPRAPQFNTAVSELAKLGVAATIVRSAMPSGRNDVMGLTSGVADFSWQRTGNTILPGAICENLTSYGGILAESREQTPLTEFLRYGAAGSCGTVIEPYAMKEKFPSPLVHVHYARGSTLAEAFYQSVFAPAQLLIVGDPLCRPWAQIPKVQVAGLPADGKVSGTVVFEPKATSPGGAAIDRFELFVDGRRVAGTHAGGTLEWDTAVEADGYHDLRVVAIEAGPIATQGRAILPVTVNNHNHTMQVSAEPAGKIAWGETLKVKMAAPGMTDLLLVNNARVIANLKGESGEFSIDPRLFGLGPIELQAVATKGAAAADRVWSAPIALEISAGRPLPALANPPANRGRGLVLQLPDQKIVRVDETRDPAWLTLHGVRPDQPFLLQGFFDADKDDVYQFQVWHYGALKLSVDGRALYSSEKGDYTQKFVPVALAAGMHRLTVSGRTGSDVKLRILFGGPGAESLNRDRFRHAR
ncbi:MAG: hypothetical protein AB7O59_12215 [Pirellulales bacterium]